MEKEKVFLGLIFVFALILRFIYFPDNIYFGYDQARDAYESQGIYKNLDLKIIGPSTANPNLFHGPLYWYLIGPLYLLGGGNPALPAALLILVNALGVFLIFYLAKTLFDEKVGILAAFLYAFSFEQTQYALYFGNPAPAVLTIILFYFGLAIFSFKKKWIGIPLSLLGLGLSIQFEFALVYLFLVFTLVVFAYRRNLATINDPKKILVSVLAFIVPLSSFFAAEILFGFRTFRTLTEVGISKGVGILGGLSNLKVYLNKLGQLSSHNFFYFDERISDVFFLVLILGSLVIIVRKLKGYDKIFFLLIWGFSSILLYLSGAPNLYYFNIGIFPAFLILAAYLMKRFLARQILYMLFLTPVLLGDIYGVLNQNQKGIINDIYVQEGMLLGRLKEAVDFIYKEVGSLPVVVSALTMPLNVNTTWSYLFSWYGKERYGKLSYWTGEVAPGYPGSLPRWQSQEENYSFFSIIEPIRGVRQPFVDAFLKDQEQYGNVTLEKKWGDLWYNQIVVQKRK